MAWEDTYEVLGDVHRVRMCEEEHAIDNRRLLEALEEAEDGLSRFE